MKWNRLGKWLFVGGAWTATMMALGVAGSGCLARNVGKQDPTTKVNFTSTVSQAAVDKVDILFAIDNSASMGDKQSILKDAVPDLIGGLLKPRCVDADGNPEKSGAVSDPTSTKEKHFGCPAGTDPEFKPVTDLHIGIVSSSLGNFGGDVCPANNPRSNDHGHLINIKQGSTGGVDLATPQGFLAWFPSVPDNDQSQPDSAKRHPAPAKPVTKLEDLQSSFQDMVVGVDQTGCGLEAQLESMYHFLIAPDPWTDVKVLDSDPNKGKATFGDGIDVEVLKERADFLRPDSLVAVIMLTDEDDSSADPLAVGGQGWAFMAKNFPSSNVLRGGQGQGTTAPRGTKACESNDPTAVGSKDCTSCAFQFASPCNEQCQIAKADPNCAISGVQGKSGPGYDGYYPSTDDDLNVRFQRMKQRYGIDPQYPIKRYIDGFTKARIPDRAAEHEVTTLPNGVLDIKDYTSTAKCTNPLFAAKLPTGAGEDYCNLQPSTRSPDQIFFAVVGGVPNQLLHFVPNDPDKSRITNDDWVKILGADPVNYDYSGIDPHMIQSVSARPGLSGADQPKGQNGSDPYNGREWNTVKGDLQYACTFDLPVDKQRTCGATDTSCDCGDANTNPPLCGGANGTTQVKAKAYPTIREFEVVRALGDQGVVSTLCPIQLTDKSAPTYGYRPAVASIIDRLKNALTTQCLPRKLRDPGAPIEAVPCLVLAQLSDVSDNCAAHGLKEPEASILTVFRQQQKAETGNAGDGGLDLSALPVCVVPQKNPVVQPGDTCKADTDPDWCYVENAAGQKPAGARCTQAVILSAGTAGLVGARFSLQCIQQAGGGDGGT